MSKRRKPNHANTRTPMTARQLQQGWPGPRGIRIRAARPGDLTDVERLVDYTGVRLASVFH